MPRTQVRLLLVCFAVGFGLLIWRDAVPVFASYISQLSPVQVQQNSLQLCQPASASGSAYVCTLPLPFSTDPAAFLQVVYFRPDVQNLAAPTLSIDNGATSHAITLKDGTALPSGALLPNGVAPTAGTAQFYLLAFNTNGAGTWRLISDAIPGSPDLPTCTRYRLSNNGTNWTVAVNGGTATVGAAIAASATQQVVLFALAANSMIAGIDIKTSTAWSGTGFTSITTTVGDSAGSATSYTSSTYEQTAAVSNTNFQDSALFKHITFAGSNVVAALTANQNLNANTITGSTDFRICVASIP